MKLKHLLTLVLMAVAGSVWAEEGDVTTNVSIDFSNGIVDGVVAGTKNSMTIGTGSGAAARVEGGWLRQGDVTNVVTIPEEERAGAKDVVTVSFKMAWGNKNGMGSRFALKNEDGETICSLSHCRWGASSNDMNINLGGLVGSAYNNAPILDRNTSFTITINYATKTISTYVKCANPNASNTFTATLTNTKPVATFETAGFNVGGNTDRADALDDLVITTTEGNYASATADYKVEFKCGDIELKEASVRSGDVNSEITITESDKAVIWKDGVKYIYDSDDAEGKTVASDGSTVVTIEFREANTYSYAVKTSYGADIVTGSNYEGETISYGYARYLNVDGTLYQSAKQNVNPWWGSSFVLSENNQVVTVNYTATAVNNVVYFTETEDIEGATRQEGGNASVRCSMLAGGYYEGEVTTLQPGKYTITTSVWGGAGGTLTFKAGEVDVLAVATTGSIVDATSEEFLITEPTVISLAGGRASGSSPWVTDFIYIVKTADYATATMSVGAAGYATFCAPFEVAVPAGVTASTATLNGDVVELASVGATIPANTPVVLEGALDETPVAGVAVAGTPVVGVLTGVYEDTPAIKDTYVLQNQTSGVGFYKVETEGIATVKANRAYLTAASGARFFGFGEETAIKAIDALTSGKAQIFDLQGRQLNSLQKGINVVNGVKILVK